jgi:hypothetical protein
MFFQVAMEDRFLIMVGGEWGKLLTNGIGYGVLFVDVDKKMKNS